MDSSVEQIAQKVKKESSDGGRRNRVGGVRGKSCVGRGAEAAVTDELCAAPEHWSSYNWPQSVFIWREQEGISHCVIKKDVDESECRIS